MPADRAEEIDALTGCETPHLIGVRHHSPVASAAMPAMLEACAPKKILLELPPEFQTWLAWLGDPKLQAPVALAAADAAGMGAAFYPFADFSPELAAVRWAVRNDVEVEAFDLPLAHRETTTAEPHKARVQDKGLLQRLYRCEEADDFEALWDRLVEARSVGASAEAIRRAGLMLGWALRVDSAADTGIDASDLARETFMRQRLAAAIHEHGAGVVAIVGSFHAAALLPEPRLWTAVDLPDQREGDPAVTSLIPYSHDLLDSRSGYPAGIRDPVWQHWVWQHADDVPALELAMTTAVSTICARLRARGHAAGVPDACEAIRVCRDLARLRRLPAPGRRELLESLQLTLAQGELLGRGRIVAGAVQQVLVGTTRGRLAPGTPRSGLAPHVEALLAALSLPGPDSDGPPAELSLDPQRSELDRRRHVALQRLTICGIPYATPVETEGLGAGDALTRRWVVAWTPSTAAMLELAGMGGATLVQATWGVIATEERRRQAQDRLTCAAELDLLGRCAEAGLAEQTRTRLLALSGRFADEATLPELLGALVLTERIVRGHVPGLPLDEDETRVDPNVPGAVPRFDPPPVTFREDLLAAALRSLSGIAGSTDPADAHALLELVRMYQHGEHALGGGRLGWAVDEIARDGSPFMQGAGGAARVELDRETSEAFATRVGSWIDAGSELAPRLSGALLVASPRFESDPTLATELIARVDDLDDDAFMRRLPALREGFDALSAMARARMLDTLAEHLDDAPAAMELDEDPETLARWAQADRAGREALAVLGLLPPVYEESAREGTARPPARAHPIVALDRWRLILGRQRRQMSGRAGAAARALDELYGQGRRQGLAGGGQDPGYPSAREWSDELEALFGADLREEILGRAAEQGRGDVIPSLDPEEVTPSIELLQQVLSLKGSLGEAQLARLRPLVARIIEQLVQALAQRVRPALSGLATSRPSRRPSGPPDLRRTLRANLRTVQHDATGRPQIIPERMVFRTRARRSLDWHLVLVVDVSGSMEPSVIYSAMMAAILSGLPALSVTFLAFDTRVIDLTEHVDDPLSLLLEVEVGGGTHIAKALRVAGQRMHTPQRTMVVLLSDFEEGWPVAALVAQVRALVETGARCLGLAALDDTGQPRCARAIAQRVVGAGMPVAALSPMQLAQWVGDQIR